MGNGTTDTITSTKTPAGDLSGPAEWINQLWSDVQRALERLGRPHVTRCGGEHLRLPWPNDRPDKHLILTRTSDNEINLCVGDHDGVWIQDDNVRMTLRVTDHDTWQLHVEVRGSFGREWLWQLLPARAAHIVGRGLKVHDFQKGYDIFCEALSHLIGK